MRWCISGRPAAILVVTVLVATLFFPTRLVSLIGIFQIQSALGLINTLPGLILPYVTLNLAFSILVMRGIFEQISPEMVDAARIDGASSWRTLREIMLPLAANGIVVVVIVNFVTAWGEYLLAVTLHERPVDAHLPGGAGDDLRRLRRVGLPARRRHVHHGHHTRHPRLRLRAALVHEGLAGRRAEDVAG